MSIGDWICSVHANCDTSGMKEEGKKRGKIWENSLKRRNVECCALNCVDEKHKSSILSGLVYLKLHTCTCCCYTDSYISDHLRKYFVCRFSMLLSTIISLRCKEESEKKKREIQRRCRIYASFSRIDRATIVSPLTSD